MGAIATVPVFDPQGNLGDIPADRLADAVKAGAVPGVHILAPDGSPGVIPAPRTQDAVRAGAKVVPIQDQPAKDFWGEAGKALWSGISALPGSIYHAVVDPLTATKEDEVRKLHQEQAADAAEESSPERNAHGFLYRNVGVPAAKLVGADVQGMEQGAAEGNPGKVLGTAAVVPATLAATEGIVRGIPAAGQLARDVLPSTERAGQAFQAVSKVAGSHTVAVTPGLSDALIQYQQLVDAGGSRSLAVSKLMNRLTSPTAAPLTYDEARLFQSNISRLSADESQRLTPVMKRQVGKISAELNDAVSNTAANAGQLDQFQSAMKEYAQAKTMEAKLEVLKKYGIKGGLAALGGGLAAAGGKLAYDLSQK